METGSLSFLGVGRLEASDTTNVIRVSRSELPDSNSGASLICLRSFTWEQLHGVELIIVAAEAPFLDEHMSFLSAVDDFLKCISRFQCASTLIILSF